MRDKELAKKDIEYMKALEANDGSAAAIATKKQELRDIPQTFDLPMELKRQTGPDKARKDSYSALVLGSWMAKIYFDMMNTPKEQVHATFTPMFID